MPVFLVAFLNGAIVYSARHNTPWRMRGLATIQMIIIALFGQKLFAIGGYVSNVASICYAAVFVMMVITARLWGLPRAYETIYIILSAIIVTFVEVQLISMAETSVGNESFSNAMTQIAIHPAPTLVASSLAFVIAMSVLLGCLRRWDGWFGLAGALVLGQAMDSLIFYPIAFYDLPLGSMVEISIVGFVLKILSTIALAPTIWWMLRRRSRKGDG